ncbi:hypothetical protein [Sphingomonas humi]|uniref:Uncharacterized protein n=1 Tax=Sphingomonas humi TaxID=335630 RepID=A0ABP7S3H6_9SPHN
MKVLVAYGQTAEGEDRSSQFAGLRTLLAGQKGISTEWLRLPVSEFSMDELLSLRLLPVGKMADALLALDLTATLLDHPRKIALLLGEPNAPELSAQAQAALMRGLSESELVLVRDGEPRPALSSASAKRVIRFDAADFSKADAPRTPGAGTKKLLKALAS